MSQLDLSVAIIFKNEMRCLERCLKSLQPLRERLSMEIVMADTGSTDGSEKIAAQYADILFDFPWINDFSAARNAVLDRCTGRWALIVDADVWLDENIDALVKLVKMQPEPPCDYVMVKALNYNSQDLTSHTISMSIALLRMAQKPRYFGVVHEAPLFGPEHRGGSSITRRDIILHHDGYVMLNDGSEEGKKKLTRNVELIREELTERPDDLRLLGQYLDSGKVEADYAEVARRAVERAKETKDPNFGPVVMSRAVQAAVEQSLPELEEWSKAAVELYPNHYLVQIDVAYVMAIEMMRQGRYEESENWAKTYLRASRKFREDKTAERALTYGTLLYGASSSECLVRLALAGARASVSRYKEAYSALSDIDYTRLPPSSIISTLQIMVQLFLVCDLSFELLMRKVWDGIREPNVPEEAVKNRVTKFLAAGRMFFGEMSPLDGDIKLISLGERQPWELFAPLAGECVLGDAAALMKCETAEEADAVLARVEKLGELPLRAVDRAIRLGAARVPTGPMTTEEADRLALRLVQNAEDYPALAVAAAHPDTLRRAHFARGLALAAVQKYDWKSGGEDALPLARAFASIERAYLTLCYAPAALDEPEVLPPMHRFGLACAAAVEALDAGDYAASVHALRDALHQNGEMRAMVAFLLGETARQEKAARVAAASPELKQMAEQVKAILKNYDPDSPEVRQLKASPAYQKVAYLIEE